MMHKTRSILLAAWVAIVAFSALAADEGDAERKALAAKGKFKIRKHRTGLAVDIAYKGDAKVGDLFEVRRGEALIGYAEVAEMAGIWPMLTFPVGGGAAGDLLTRVALPMPKVELLTDDLEARTTKEMRALCGDRLIPVKIGDRMRAPAQDEALVVIYYAGAPFMMGDPIVQPHAANGGRVVCDMMAYCHLRGIPADESFFDQPPNLRIIDIRPLTRGLTEEARIPSYGRRERLVDVPVRPARPRKGREKPAKPPTRKVKKLQYVARIAKGTPTREEAKRIATDESTDNTAMVFEDWPATSSPPTAAAGSTRARRTSGSSSPAPWAPAPSTRSSAPPSPTGATSATRSRPSSPTTPSASRPPWRAAPAAPTTSSRASPSAPRASRSSSSSDASKGTTGSPPARCSGSSSCCSTPRTTKWSG